MLPRKGTNGHVLGVPLIALQDSLKEDWVAYESNGASPYWKVGEDRNDTLFSYFIFNLEAQTYDLSSVF